VRSILAARTEGGPFADLFDLVERVDVKTVNRKVYEALIKCGALDPLPGNRAQLLDALDAALEVAARAARDRESGQGSLFGDLRGSAPVAQTVAAPAPGALDDGTAGLGKGDARHLRFGPSAGRRHGSARAHRRHADPRTACRRRRERRARRRLVTSVRRTLTKAQTQMLIATVEDTTGTIECIVFPKQYAELQARFVEDAIVVVSGRLRIRERRGAAPGEEAPLELSVSVSDVQTFDRSAVRTSQPPAGWHVTVTSRHQIDDLALLMSEWSGTTPLVLHINGLHRAARRRRRSPRRRTAGRDRRRLERGRGSAVKRARADETAGRRP
jgi:DNA polymerase III alpha subunit